MQLVMVMQTSKLISLLIMCYGKSVLKYGIVFCKACKKNVVQGCNNNKKKIKQHDNLP